MVPSRFVLMPVLALALLPSRSLAQCPGPEPSLASVVNGNSVFLQSCHQLDPGGGCMSALPPSVVPGSTLIQETTLETTIPAGFTATEVRWTAYYRDSESDPAVAIWEHRMTAGQPYAPGTVVRLGAPGLKAGKEALFRVTYCGSTGCYCWSPIGASTTTSAFSTTAPTPPAATAIREIEEHFTRPTTTSKSAGEGLGPGAVWSDMGARVVDGTDSGTEGDMAEVIQAGLASRKSNSGHARVWAESVVRADRAVKPSEYNIDVFARQFIPVGTIYPKAYYVKVVHEDDLYAGKPTLLIGRTANNTRHEFETQALDLENSGQTKCPSNGILPLEEADPAESGKSKAVWLRIEVKDVASEPRVQGTVAWGCSTGTIEECANVCQTVEVVDAGDPEEMREKNGERGFCSHHKTHYFELFRAGSIPPQ